MQKRVFVFFVILCAIAIGGGYEEDKYFWGAVTVEQAKQAIIQWSGRSNLIIKQVPPGEMDLEELAYGDCAGGGMRGIHPTAHGMFIKCYVFEVEDPNPDHKFSGWVGVDSHTGAIAIMSTRHVAISKGNISDMIPPPQAISLARQITASYFPHIPIYSFEGVKTMPDIGSNGSWEEYNPAITVWLYNRLLTQKGEVEVGIQEVMVGLDSQTGEPEDIVVIYEPLQIDPTPTLTVEEAVQALISYLYGLGADSVEIRDISKRWYIEKESPNGPQHIYIIITCWVTEPEGSNIFPYPMWSCAIDGHTGELIWGNFWVPPWGGPLQKSKKVFPPSLFFDGKETKAKLILKGEKVYINIEDLKAVGFKVEKGEGKCTISYKDEKADFAGEEILQKGKDVFIEGESLGKLKGVMAKYRKEFKEFHIWIKNEKAYKKGLEDREKLGKGKPAPSIPSPEKKSPPQKSGLLLYSGLSLPAIGYVLWRFLKRVA
ncbi:MAG: hypothetical protein ACPLPS_10975 [bacterium]